MKYSNLISYLKFVVQPSRSRIKNTAIRSYYGKKTTKILTLILSLAIVVLVVYIAKMVIPMGKESVIPEHLKEISPITYVSATSYSDKVITSDCDFKVITKKNLSKKAFSKVFEISPAAEFKIKKTSGNTFTISFKDPLAENTTYRINSLNEGKTVYSWAFQTARDFKITNNNIVSSYIAQNTPITVEFSHSNVENFEENFSIHPAIAGTFAHNEKNWTFIPSVEYENDVLYTVTISKNTIGGSQQTLENDYSFSFSLEPEKQKNYIKPLNTTLDKIDCYTTKEIPVASFICKNYNPTKADVSVYRIDTAENFISIHKRNVSGDLISKALSEDLENLVKSTIFTASFETNGDIAYLKYPQNLENGYYISQIISKDTTLYHIFQVTDLVVYSVSSNNDHTVWVNSAITGEPVISAAVTLDGYERATTNAKGVATFDNVNSSYQSSGYLTISANTLYNEYVTKLDCSNETSALNNKAYISTIKSEYAPLDTVKVWGFTDKSDKHNEFSVFDSANNEYHAIEIDQSGYFEFDFSLPQIESNHKFYVSLLCDQKEIAKKAFEVKKDNQLNYLEIKTDKYGYFQGETIQYTVKSYFSNGTPAPNTEILYYGDKILVTDENALATFSKPALHSNSSSNPECSTQAFYIKQPDGTLVEFFNECIVFPSEYQLDANKLTTTEGELIQLSLNTINQNLFDNGVIDANLNSKTTYIGQATNGTVNSELHKVSYEKELSDTVYNPLTESDYEIYSYKEKDEIILLEQINVENGIANISVPDLETDACKYYYTFSITDSKERKTIKKLYVYDNPPLESQYEYTISTNKKEYSTNELVHANIIGNDTILEEGSLILSFINGDIIDSLVFTDISKIDFEFNTDFGPKTFLYAAVFNGSSIKTVEPSAIFSKSSSLDIEISPDKESYLPGEKATFTITSKYNNEPVSATLAVNIKDGKYSRKYPEHNYFSKSVYDTDFSADDVITGHSSYNVYKPEIKQQLNSEEITVIYKDLESLFFQKITTNQDGKATVSFTIPQKNSDLVIVANGFSPDFILGSAQLNFVAHKEFYIEAYVPEQIKANDDAIIDFSFNSKTEISDSCVYSLTLFKNGTTADTFNDEALINQLVSTNFGKLECGKYTVRLSAKSAYFTDVQEFNFTVIDSYSLSDYRTTNLLEYEYSITPDIFDSNVIVKLYDEQLEFSNSVLEILSVINSDSFEKKYVSNTAMQFLNNGSIPKQNFDVSLISNLPIDRLAMITDTMSNCFNKQQLSEHLFSVVNNSMNDTEKLYCYYALSSLGNPVLSELTYYYDKLSELDIEQSLCLALAYSSAGDETTAYTIFNKAISPKIMTANGVSKIDSKISGTQTVKLTALAINLTSKISATEAKNLVKFLISDKQSTSDYSFILLNFCLNYTPETITHHKVTVRYANKTKQTIKFNSKEIRYIQLSNEDIVSTVFSTNSENCIISVAGKTSTNTIISKMQKSGDSNYISAYIGELSDKDQTFDININCSHIDSFNGKKQFTLFLPYSLEYVSNDLQKESGFCTKDGSKITVEYYSDTLSFNIKCKATKQGEFTLEPIVLFDINNNKYIASEKLSFITQKNNREA